MHDVGMNMSQLAMSVKQVDDTIELAHEWSHQLLHATENFDMERIGAKLEAAMAALHEAHDALEGYEDAIEAEGIRRSWKKLEEAGLILAVFDGSEPPSREDLALAQRCAGRPAIALVNKEDKPTRFDAELIAPYFAMVLPVCCREEGSRKVIAAAVARLLGTGSIDPHAASLSGQRQLSAALRARDAVAGALDAAAGGPQGAHGYSAHPTARLYQQQPGTG